MKPREKHRVLGSGAAPVWLPVMELENLAPVVASMLLELQTTDSMKELEIAPAKTKAMARARATMMPILEQAQADSSAALGSESQSQGK